MSRPRSPKYGTGNPGRVSRPTAGLSGVRTQLYKTAKVLGDVSAVQSGNIGPRVMRRMMGKGASKGMSGFMGKMF